MANEIGESIRLFRERTGFTQKNLAEFLAVDQSLISKFEKGERAVSSDTLEKIAALFGVSIECLEAGKTDTELLSYAFRANHLSAEDMEAVSAINRIALNSEYMGKLLGEADI